MEADDRMPEFISKLNAKIDRTRNKIHYRWLDTDKRLNKNYIGK